jgi:hypothetical protein
MESPSLVFDSWNAPWRGLWRKLAPPPGPERCVHARSWWRRLRGRPRGILFHGAWYCLDGCLESVLTTKLPSPHPRAAQPGGGCRVPLGLLLLSRQQLTIEQLRAALDTQRAAGRGRIGEWLQHLGFVTEQQVTAALARQWSCPVLRPGSRLLGPDCPLQIPVTLLESFVMLPVAYVPSTAALHIAFAERIDYGVLYALEQMLGCRTEPCLAVPSALRRGLRGFTERRGESEVVFDRVADAAEFTRIVRSYAVRIAAAEIRLAACGPHVWIRLLRGEGPPLDLLLRSPMQASPGGAGTTTPAAATV